MCICNRTGAMGEARGRCPTPVYIYIYVYRYIYISIYLYIGHGSRTLATGGRGFSGLRVEN